MVRKDQSKDRESPKPRAGQPPGDTLRQRAEEMVKASPEVLESMSAEDIREVVHELKVHQVELEMQNEEMARTQSELDRSRGRYVDLYDFAPVGYFTFDSQGTILEVNLTGADQLGLERTYVRGKSLCGLLDQYAANAFFLHRQEVLKTRTRQTVELKVKRRSGQEFYARLESIAVQDEEGNFTRLRTALTDITQAKLAEEKIRESQRSLEETVAELEEANRKLQVEVEKHRRTLKALQESEAKYETLVEQATDGVIIVREGNLIFANQAMAEISGYTKDELLGRPMIDLVAAELRQMVNNRYRARLSGQPVPSIYESKIQRRDGTIREVEVSANIIRYQGRPALMSVVRDLTERKRLEAERQRTLRLESIGVLAGGIAHDFRNVLVGIVGGLSLVRLHLEPGSKALDLLDQAEKAAEKATYLSQQLLTFAQGGAPIKKASSLSDLLVDAVSFPLQGSRSRSVFHLPEDLWPVEIDRGQISEVVNNLVINAEQAMPKGGIISVSAENVTLGPGDQVPLAAGDYVRVSVTDQGIGIPEKYLESIFDPYFSTKQEGSGLGLAIVHSIIRRHGGFITVESKMGTGTTFTFYLPAVPAQMRALAGREAGMEAEPEIFRGQGRVLIMEDEKIVQNILAKMLQTLGFDVELTLDGAEALERYRQARESGRPFQAVILDLIIPGGMDGRETLRRLRGIDPEVRAIVSSGYANDPIISHYQAEGFRGALAKPYEIRELASTLQRALS